MLVAALLLVYTGEKYEYKSNSDVKFGEGTTSKYDGIYILWCEKGIPYWYPYDGGEWVDGDMYLCVTFKDGKIYQTSPTNSCQKGCYDTQEVSGTYDSSGSVSFTFTFKEYGTDDESGRIVKGTFSGTVKVDGCPYPYWGGCVEGNIKANVRDYNTSKIGGGPFDVTKDISAEMDGWRMDTL